MLVVKIRANQKSTITVPVSPKNHHLSETMEDCLRHVPSFLGNLLALRNKS